MFDKSIKPENNNYLGICWYAYVYDLGPMLLSIKL